MATSSWQAEQGEDAPEDLETILREDSEEDCDEDFEIDLSDKDPEEEIDQQSYVDPLNMAPEGECAELIPSRLGRYTEEGEEAPLMPYASPLRAPSPSGVKSVCSRSLQPPSSAHTEIQGVCQPFDVVVVVMEEEETSQPAPATSDDVMENDFHLADEHHVQNVANTPHDSYRERGTGRKSRGARGRRGRDTGDPQWRRGDRLVQIYVNDEDVPEDLRKMVMQLVNAREAARLRAASKARKRKHDEKDEWLDAEDGHDEALFAGTDISSRFEWSSMTDYAGKRECFQPNVTGPVHPSKNAYEAFRQYWDDDILQHIVTETNSHAQGLASSSPTFAQKWYDTNLHEIIVLFCFWMMLGIIRMPSTKSCFTTNPLLQTFIFRKLFSRSRYNNLCRALHFNDVRNKPADSSDPLFCFGPVLEHLNSRFMAAYVPSQNICIDESLTLWKGNLVFRQYETKTARLGVKTYELCESSTGYLWSFFVYNGAGIIFEASNNPSTLQKSTATVLKLVRPLLDKGYTLFLDKFFNSPVLARYLKAHKTDCVGTLCADLPNVPPLISACKLNEGQFVARHSGDVVVMASQDCNRKFTTISTYHGIRQDLTEATQFREVQYKPQVILDYNKNMGGVDRKDQMLEPYLLERKKCSKWHMKVFKRLLNCSILNSRIHLEASTSTHKDHLVFRLELVDQLLQKHHNHVPKKHNSSIGRPPVQCNFGQPDMVNWRHYPKLIITKDARNRTSRRRCAHCSKNGIYKRTLHVCPACGDTPLCVDPCFELYHSKFS